MDYGVSGYSSKQDRVVLSFKHKNNDKKSFIIEFRYKKEGIYESLNPTYITELGKTKRPITVTDANLVSMVVNDPTAQEFFRICNEK